MKKLEWIEAMRGIAALWVVTLHSYYAARDFAGFVGNQVIANGYLGVDFFFVLSGFIIAISSRSLIANGSGISEYASARIIRIYVPYLPIGALMLILYSLFPTVSQGTRESIGVLTSLTLLPSSSPPALSVAWTLVHEVVFYAIFSVYFVSRALLLFILGIWSIAICAWWTFALPLPLPFNYFLSPLNLCFILGVATAWAVRRGIPGPIACLAAVAGLAMVSIQAVSNEPNRVATAIGFACLVAASRAEGAQARAPARSLIVLGAASYAVYLVHNSAISALVRLFHKVPSPTALFLLICIFAVLAGIAYHYAYERQALSLVRRLKQNRSTPVKRIA